MRRTALLLALAAAAPLAAQQRTPTVEAQSASTTALLQAVSVVDSSTVWASGHGATWARTTDGGRSWQAGTVPGDTALEFRDVHAASATEAWLLAAGPGDRSRIFHTTNGGATWQQQWVNEEPAGFYDCMDFWDGQRGIVYGDAVDGQVRVLRTWDGGATWDLVPNRWLPAAQPGEGGFAASGTCAIARAGGRGWIAAGNAGRARAFRTINYGASWTAADVPVEAGEGAGLASVAMQTDSLGWAFGGNLGVTDRRTMNGARTTDGGATWTALPTMRMLGAVYGVAHVRGWGNTLVAVGPGGVDVSNDGGSTWRSLDTRAFWGIASGGPNATWITGPGGRIVRLRFN